MQTLHVHLLLLILLETKISYVQYVGLFARCMYTAYEQASMYPENVYTIINNFSLTRSLIQKLVMPADI